MPLHCATEGIFSTPIHFVVHFILDMVLRQSHPEYSRVRCGRKSQKKEKPKLSFFYRDCHVLSLVRVWTVSVAREGRE